MKYVILLITLLSLVFLVSSCAVNPATGQQDLVLMSEDKEIALGRQTHGQVLQQYGEYDDPELQAYVRRIGTLLAENSHRSNLVYRFTVLDSKEVNAFALPGGYIYITRGLMAYLNNEAELAAVLGHEIGHVTARHAVRQYSATQLANIGVTLGAIFIPGMGNAGVSQLTQLFGTALLRGYGREHELEADRLGAEYLARTKYDPQAMFSVIRALKNQELFEAQLAKAEGREPRYYHGLFSTHPDNDTRLKEIIAHAEENIQSPSRKKNRKAYLHQTDGMVYGDSAQQGILRGRDFYHHELGFVMRFPQDWRVINQPSQLVANSPDGNAVLQIGLEDINKKISPREFIISRLNIKNLTKDKALEINGHPAHTGIATMNTSAGTLPGRITVIYFDNRAYIFAGLTKKSRLFETYDRFFLETAQSFHTITDKEKEKAQPLHLKLVSLDDSMNFASLAKESPLEYYPAEQLRLINGLYPKGEPKENALIKVIE